MLSERRGPATSGRTKGSGAAARRRLRALVPFVLLLRAHIRLSGIDLPLELRPLRWEEALPVGPALAVAVVSLAPLPSIRLCADG